MVARQRKNQTVIEATGVAHQRLRFGALAHHQRIAPAADFVRSFEEG